MFSKKILREDMLNRYMQGHGQSCLGLDPQGYCNYDPDPDGKELI